MLSTNKYLAFVKNSKKGPSRLKNNFSDDLRNREPREVYNRTK